MKEHEQRKKILILQTCACNRNFVSQNRNQLISFCELICWRFFCECEFERFSVWLWWPNFRLVNAPNGKLATGQQTSGENVTSIKAVFTFDSFFSCCRARARFLFSLCRSIRLKTHAISGALSLLIRYKCENTHEYLLCNSFHCTSHSNSFISHEFFRCVYFDCDRILFIFWIVLWSRNMIYFVYILMVFFSVLMTCWMCGTMTIKQSTMLIMHCVASTCEHGVLLCLFRVKGLFPFR